MGLLAWIIFGALAGWLASTIARRPQGCFLNVVVGIIGAFIGGMVMQFLTGSRLSLRFNLPSFAVAVLGAVILLALARLATPPRR